MSLLLSGGFSDYLHVPQLLGSCLDGILWQVCGMPAN